jgi:hypothetical protein
MDVADAVTDYRATEEEIQIPAKIRELKEPA